MARSLSSNQGPEEAAALSTLQLGLISIYIDILLRWNARINLTAVREPEQIVTRHFGESLFAARLLFPRSGVVGASGFSRETPHVIDVGSGAGFPGLPIKIWAPEVQLTLIESNHKKATFLREVVRTLDLVNVDVFAGRAENFSGGKGDVVTLRAVERFESALPLAAALMRPQGRLAVFAGKSQLRTIHEGLCGLKWREAVSLPLSDSRLVMVGVKNQNDHRGL